MAWKVQVSREVKAGLYALSDEEREPVERAIGRLALGPNPPGAPQAYELKEPPGIHVLGAGPRFRLLYSVGDDQDIIVLDIVSNESVQRYFAKATS